MSSRGPRRLYAVCDRATHSRLRVLIPVLILIAPFAGVVVGRTAPASALPLTLVPTSAQEHVTGMAVDQAGNVYIADDNPGDNNPSSGTFGIREYLRSASYAFAASRYIPATTTDQCGAPAQLLGSPGALAVDAAGDVFVVQEDCGQVLEMENPFTSNYRGQVVDVADIASPHPELQASPSSLSVADDTLGTHLVVAVHNAVAEFTQLGGGPWTFDGNILDTSSAPPSRLTPDYSAVSFAALFPTSGTGNEMVPRSTLYVLDANNGLVWNCSPTTPAQVDYCNSLTGDPFTAAGGFGGLFVDPLGDVFLSDFSDSVIQEWSPPCANLRLDPPVFLGEDTKSNIGCYSSWQYGQGLTVAHDTDNPTALSEDSLGDVFVLDDSGVVEFANVAFGQASDGGTTYQCSGVPMPQGMYLGDGTSSGGQIFGSSAGTISVAGDSFESPDYTLSVGSNETDVYLHGRVWCDRLTAYFDPYSVNAGPQEESFYVGSITTGPSGDTTAAGTYSSYAVPLGTTPLDTGTWRAGYVVTSATDVGGAHTTDTSGNLSASVTAASPDQQVTIGTTTLTQQTQTPCPLAKSGFCVLGYYIDIAAPPAPDDSTPITLTFTLQSVAIVNGKRLYPTVYHNGVQLPYCQTDPSTGRQVLDPSDDATGCIATVNPITGVPPVTVTVLTRTASVWTVGVPASRKTALTGRIVCDVTGTVTTSQPLLPAPARPRRTAFKFNGSFANCSGNYVGPKASALPVSGATFKGVGYEASNDCNAIANNVAPTMPVKLKIKWTSPSGKSPGSTTAILNLTPGWYGYLLFVDNTAEVTTGPAFDTEPINLPLLLTNEGAGWSGSCAGSTTTLTFPNPIDPAQVSIGT